MDDQKVRNYGYAVLAFPEYYLRDTPDFTTFAKSLKGAKKVQADFHSKGLKTDLWILTRDGIPPGENIQYTED